MACPLCASQHTGNRVRGSMIVVLNLERRQVQPRVATVLLKVAQLLSGRAIIGLVLSTNPQPLGSERIQNKMNGFSQSEKISLLRMIIAILC